MVECFHVVAIDLVDVIVGNLNHVAPKSHAIDLIIGAAFNTFRGFLTGNLSLISTRLGHGEHLFLRLLTVRLFALVLVIGLLANSFG